MAIKNPSRIEKGYRIGDVPDLGGTSHFWIFTFMTL